MTLEKPHQWRAITLSSELQEKGVTDLGGLKRLIDRSAPGSYTFAHTFPTGTHAMWLYYWLAAPASSRFNDVRTVVVPPPQMVMNMRIGNMSGFCVGEPWNARALTTVSATAATSGISGPSIRKRCWAPVATGWNLANTARALVAALMEAQRWTAASPENTRETARLLARRGWLNTRSNTSPAGCLESMTAALAAAGRMPIDALLGRGRGDFPWLSDGMWFLTSSAAGVAEAGSGLPRGGVAH